MNTKLIRIIVLGVLFTLPLTVSSFAFADDIEDQVAPVTPSAPPPDLEALEKKYAPRLVDKKDLEQRIIENIPFAEDLKPVWHLVDGKTDVFIPNLRVDRRNKGLTYTTNTIPFIGTFEGTELKFKAGEDMKFTFESDYIPFMGRLEGFNVKASVSEDESSIFARYTIPLD